MKDNKIQRNSEIRVENNDITFEISIEPILNSSDEITKINKELSMIEDALSENELRLERLLSDRDRLKNQSDKLDYMAAVASGVFSAVVDLFWVGSFNIEEGNRWSDETIGEFVKSVANGTGYKGNDLAGAIRHLELKYGSPGDGAKDQFGGGLQHHLRDFSHHPSIVGLVCSIAMQFTQTAFGTDTAGNFISVDITDTSFIGKTFGQKIVFGTVNWLMHLISDMAGSSSNPGEGTGIPGPLLSALKELSSLPFFQNFKDHNGNSEFSVWLSKLFNGTLLGERDEDGRIIRESSKQMRFDLREELGILEQVGRQTVPIILNECIVRAFYFVRRLTSEIKEKDIRTIRELKVIDWNRVKPFKNGTIIRMLTISSSVFMVIDMSDATFRAAFSSGGVQEEFARQFLVRVNFVGIGRFSVAIGSESIRVLDKRSNHDSRLIALSERLNYMNAKIYYYQAKSWHASETTQKAIDEAIALKEETTIQYLETVSENKESLVRIGTYSDSVNEKNKGLNDEIKKVLKGGIIK